MRHLRHHRPRANRGWCRVRHRIPRLHQSWTKRYARCTYQITELHTQRMSALRAHYLAPKGMSGSATIPPHFSLQSALMELSDADLETSAMRARTEFLEASLVRTQEDAFAYSAMSTSQRP